MAINGIVSILVDFSPTLYCLPKSLVLSLYGSMALVSYIIITILLTMYYNSVLCFLMFGGSAYGD